MHSVFSVESAFLVKRVAFRQLLALSRGDSGFCRLRILNYRERAGVHYSNPRKTQSSASKPSGQVPFRPTSGHSVRAWRHANSITYRARHCPVEKDGLTLGPRRQLAVRLGRRSAPRLNPGFTPRFSFDAGAFRGAGHPSITGSFGHSRLTSRRPIRGTGASGVCRRDRVVYNTYTIRT